MNDRDYVKVNTSIRTGSNANNLLTDQDGNIQATIELRLPDDLFKQSSGARKLDSVQMQTGKFRLSLENTPIAALPVDENLSGSTLNATPCQLDVYPFSILNGNQILPPPLPVDAPYSQTVFPRYKQHVIVYNLYILSDSPDIDYDAPLFSITQPIILGSTNVCPTPKPSDYETASEYNNAVAFVDFLKQTTIFDDVQHRFNLCLKNNHEYLLRENSTFFVKNIATLEQVLEDALENAVQYASTSYTVTISCITVMTNPKPDFFDQLQPPPNESITGSIRFSSEIDYCFWKYEMAITQRQNDLNSSFKPRVTLGGDTLSIAYDTAPFNALIPILWSPGIVDTFDTPLQLTMGELQRRLWPRQPPPVKKFKYSCNESDEGKSYTMGITNAAGAVMNIIANREMRDTFSFLPWIEFNITALTRNYYTQLLKDLKETEIHDERADYYVVRSAKVGGTYQPVIPYEFEFLGSPAKKNMASANYVFYTLDGKDPMDENNRFQQNTSFVGDDWDPPVMQRNLPKYRTSENVLPVLPEEKIVTCSSGHDSAVVSGEEIVSPPVETYITGEAPATEWESYLGLTSEYLYKTDNGWEWGYHPGGSTLWGGPHYKQQIPPFAPDNVEVVNTTITIEGVATAVQQYTWWWYFPATDEPLMIRFGAGGAADTWIMKRNLPSLTKITTSRVKETTTFTEDEALKIFYPNMSLSNDQTFYVLDGTTVETTITGPDPVGESVTYTKTTETTTTSTKTDSHLYQTYGVAHQLLVDDTATVVPYFGYHMSTLADMGRIMFEWYRATGGTASTSWIDPDAPGIENAALKYTMVYHKQINGTLAEVRYYLNPTTYITYTYSNGRPPSFTITGAAPQAASLTTSYEPFFNEDIPNDPSETVITTEQSETNIPAEQYYHPPYEHDTERSTEPKVENQLTTLPIATLVKGYSRRELNSDLVWGDSHQAPSGMHYDDINFPPAPGEIEELEIPSIFKYFPTPQATQYYRTIETTDAADNNITESWGLFDVTLPETAYYLVGPRVDVGILTKKTYTLTSVIDKTTSYTIDSKNQGNIHITYIWPNLPMVVLSPIQSIVLTLQGIRVNQEYQPINITEKDGSSLTATFPIVENFYSLANTLRDLHDELVVVKDDFDSTATYTLDIQSGQERTLRLSAYYITKDGTLHQIYIPPNGVFSLQLIFGLSFYYTS